MSYNMKAHICVCTLKTKYHYGQSICILLLCLEGVRTIEYLKDVRIRNAVVIYKIMTNEEVQAYLNELFDLIRKHFGNNKNTQQVNENVKGDCL